MRVLIVGKNSYIGDHIERWLSDRGCSVFQLDVLADDWLTFDYSGFDTIVHVAGIVHQPNCHDWDLYKRVNADMPVAIARKAKESGVKQYVFFSTMGVYGVDKKLTPNIIGANTPLAPDDMYGKSKLMAEEGLRKLQDDQFRIVCVRPPSVYGKGCRGGYILGFASIVKLLPIIPQVYNNVKQSFIYIDNLSELVYQIVVNNLDGVFCPQDDKSVSANELLQAIAFGMGKKYRSSSLLGIFVRLICFLPIVKKAYGGIVYDTNLSTINNINYVVVPFEEGIRRTMEK